MNVIISKSMLGKIQKCKKKPILINFSSMLFCYKKRRFLYTIKVLARNLMHNWLKDIEKIQIWVIIQMLNIFKSLDLVSCNPWFVLINLLNIRTNSMHCPRKYKIFWVTNIASLNEVISYSSMHQNLLGLFYAKSKHQLKVHQDNLLLVEA